MQRLGCKYGRSVLVSYHNVEIKKAFIHPHFEALDYLFQLIGELFLQVSSFCFKSGVRRKVPWSCLLPFTYTINITTIKRTKRLIEKNSPESKIQPMTSSFFSSPMTTEGRKENVADTSSSSPATTSAPLHVPFLYDSHPYQDIVITRKDVRNGMHDVEKLASSSEALQKAVLHVSEIAKQFERDLKMCASGPALEKQVVEQFTECRCKFRALFEQLEAMVTSACSVCCIVH
jgi:hypothetical protein